MIEEEKEEEEKSSEPEKGPICGVCLDMITDDKRSIAPVCGHTYHIKCMEMTIDSFVNSNKFPIKCPEYKCDTLLQDWFIRE